MVQSSTFWLLQRKGTTARPELINLTVHLVQVPGMGAASKQHAPGWQHTGEDGKKQQFPGKQNHFRAKLHFSELKRSPETWEKEVLFHTSTEGGITSCRYAAEKSLGSLFSIAGPKTHLCVGPRGSHSSTRASLMDRARQCEEEEEGEREVMLTLRPAVPVL